MNESRIKKAKTLLRSSPLSNQGRKTIPRLRNPDEMTVSMVLIEAKEVLDVMIWRGIEPDAVTYNYLIDGYYLPNIMDKAVKAFKIMAEKGVFAY